jgi:uncharacterized protein
MPKTLLRINPCVSGIRFSAFIQPRSSQNEVLGVHGNSLKIRLTSPPANGAANKNCVKFIAKWLRISPSKVRIVAGLSNKNKIIEIEGIDKPTFLNKLKTKTPNPIRKKAND